MKKGAAGSPVLTSITTFALVSTETLKISSLIKHYDSVNIDATSVSKYSRLTHIFS